MGCRDGLEDGVWSGPEVGSEALGIETWSPPVEAALHLDEYGKTTHTQHMI